jgi:hypothetical protein
LDTHLSFVQHINAQPVEQKGNHELYDVKPFLISPNLVVASAEDTPTVGKQNGGNKMCHMILHHLSCT